MSDVVVGIDVGGTRVKAGLVDQTGRLANVQVRGVLDADRSEAGMVKLVAELVAHYGKNGGVRGVGLGIPGTVDVAAGRVSSSPNFPEWNDFSVISRLVEAGVRVPVALDNDANVVAIGEACYGAARGVDSFVLLTLGTGVGGAIQLGGRLWRGVDGMAGELGHVNVVPDGRLCGCGSRGCLEQYASLNGLRHEVRARSMEIDDAEALLDDPDLPKKLYDRAANGDAEARAIFEDMGSWLGLALGSLLNVLNVKTVVLAGGLAGALPMFERPMMAAIAHHSFPAIHQGLRVVVGTLGEAAGVLGAAALVRAALDQPAA